MELLKLLSTSAIVAQIISFLILLFILKLFLWKPILKALEDRRTRIADEFNNIEAVKKEVADVRAEYEKNISSINETAKAKYQEALADGKKMAEEIKKDAQANAKKIIDNARETIDIEVAKARSRLKADIVDLTIAATEEIVQQKLTEEQDKKLVMDFLDKLDKIE